MVSIREIIIYSTVMIALFPSFLFISRDSIDDNDATFFFPSPSSFSELSGQLAPAKFPVTDPLPSLLYSVISLLLADTIASGAFSSHHRIQGPGMRVICFHKKISLNGVQSLGMHVSKGHSFS